MMSLSESATLNNGQPAPCPHSCPGDRVVYADSWQGELDTPDQVEPMPADIAWLNTHPAPEPFEPTPADWEDMARHAEWADRVAAIRREDDAQVEAQARYAL
jgi:hypothetical protein